MEKEINTTSDTPETDSFFFRIDIEWDMEVEFAQKLERERNEARKEAARWRDAWKSEYKKSIIINTALPWEGYNELVFNISKRKQRLGHL
jgi:hypothetical protein